MQYNLIACFDSEIRNVVNLELRKPNCNIEYWNTIKKYLELRIKELEQELVDIETKLLHGNRQEERSH